MIQRVITASQQSTTCQFLISHFLQAGPLGVLSYTDYGKQRPEHGSEFLLRTERFKTLRIQNGNHLL